MYHVNKPINMSSSVLLGLLLVVVIRPAWTTARLVSPELRRLSLSTNQFGIDVLKALDKIEPPDKVLVFCPVCVSSSLVMVMMGSSKYQVVSGLRHALYVWSLSPQEIKDGFKGLLDHIGLNEYNVHITSEIPTYDDTKTNKHGSRDSTAISEIRQYSDKKWNINKQISRSMPDNLFEIMGALGEHMSLPSIIRFRELMDKSMQENLVVVEQKLEHLHDKYLEGNNMTIGFTNRSRIFRQRKASLGIADDMTQMSTTANIYIQRGLHVNYNYNLLLRQYFKTNIHPVDFIHNAEETRLHINSLVSTSTEGKIAELMDKKSLAKNSKVMIISSFHFRGTLDVKIKMIGSEKSTIQHKNNQNMTSGQEYGVSENLKRDFILIEETLLKFGNFPDLGCSMVEIPFSNRLVSLLIIMPDQANSTQLILTKLSAQILSDLISSLKVKKISLEIPVIRFDRGPINMHGMLKELGIDAFFLEQIRHSTETGLNRWMHPQHIVHETSIDIGTINPQWIETEDRLKVGAHSDKRSSRQDTRADNHNYMKLDKPFLYFVMDSMNNLILTMGRIRQ